MKSPVDLDQYDRLARVDEALSAYLKLDAEKAVAVADYNERLKNLWHEVELANAEAHDPQASLPMGGAANG